MPTLRRLALCCLCLNATWGWAAPPLPTAHETRQVEGFTVRIDRRLLDADVSRAGIDPVKLLEARLVALAAVVPAGPLKKLREVPIQIDRDYGELRPMQYHPSAGWLKSHGYAENLAKCVHIPDAGYFASRHEAFRQPAAILHELAHAYHDRELGFEEPRIRQAFERVRDSQRLDSVLLIGGRKGRHYALTNEKEFFAEMTESYLGTNDFYPFVAGELKESDPETYDLLQNIWGEHP